MIFGYSDLENMFAMYIIGGEKFTTFWPKRHKYTPKWGLNINFTK